MSKKGCGWHAPLVACRELNPICDHAFDYLSLRRDDAPTTKSHLSPPRPQGQVECHSILENTFYHSHARLFGHFLIFLNHLPSCLHPSDQSLISRHGQGGEKPVTGLTGFSGLWQRRLPFAPSEYHRQFTQNFVLATPTSTHFQFHPVGRASSSLRISARISGSSSSKSRPRS